MRIDFANTTREPFPWAGGDLRVGSAADNDLVLAAGGVAGHHLRLSNDARGLVLEVLAGASRVYVNARPVRERALLVAGDSLAVGECRLRLCADVDTAPVDDTPEVDATTAVAALRVVGGPQCGRVLALHRRMDIGPRGRLPLALPGAADAAMVLSRAEDGWHLGLTAIPERFPVYLNGNPVRTARLRHGDQIVLGAHHFVFDAWPTPHAEQAHFVPHEQPLPEDTAGPRGEVWWLIATAAALGLLIALLLFLHF